LLKAEFGLKNHRVCGCWVVIVCDIKHFKCSAISALLNLVLHFEVQDCLAESNEGMCTSRQYKGSAVSGTRGCREGVKGKDRERCSAVFGLTPSRQ